MDDSKLPRQCFRNSQSHLVSLRFVPFRLPSSSSVHLFSFFFFTLLQFEHTLKNVSCRGLLSYYFRRRRRRRWVCCNPRRLRFPRSVYRTHTSLHSLSTSSSSASSSSTWVICNFYQLLLQYCTTAARHRNRPN